MPTSSTLDLVITDLAAEQDALDSLVANIDDTSWTLMTPSPNWRIVEQIEHLASTDHTAAMAISHPDDFIEHRDALFAGRGRDSTLDRGSLEPAALLAWWRECRAELAAAAATTTHGQRIEWYGPSMGAASFLTARLMECWAHGVDVADTLGAELPVTDRLRHIAQLGYITRGWTYANRGDDMPAADIRVELTSPSGESWRFGPETARESISGSALDFALVTTQRRNVADTDLVVEGAAAVDWMSKTQLFAGRPTDPPPPRK